MPTMPEALGAGAAGAALIAARVAEREARFVPEED